MRAARKGGKIERETATAAGTAAAVLHLSAHALYYGIGSTHQCSFIRRLLKLLEVLFCCKIISIIRIVLEGFSSSRALAEVALYFTFTKMRFTTRSLYGLRILPESYLDFYMSKDERCPQTCKNSKFQFRYFYLANVFKYLWRMKLSLHAWL